MTSAGRNALDFHMSCYLGRLWALDPDAYLRVIAKDTGLDSALAHMREQGAHAQRWEDACDIPLVKKPATQPDDEKLSRIMEYLIVRAGQRPASLKTLSGSIAALFLPKLSEAETSAFIRELCANGVCEIVDVKVRYGLPD